MPLTQFHRPVCLPRLCDSAGVYACEETLYRLPLIMKCSCCVTWLTLPHRYPSLGSYFL